MIDRTSLLHPMFALAAWTSCVLLMVAYRRIIGSSGVRVGPNEFALGESPKVPEGAVLANRYYMNLLELPMLFYVGCLTAYVTDVVTDLMVTLAWIYVALRIVHSLIHVTYNSVLHRFLAFASSNVVLVTFWVLVGVGAIDSGGR